MPCSICAPLDARDAQIKKVSLLKRNALAAPFERAFAEQKRLETAGGQGELMAVHYRDEEAIYVQASADRVTVIFSTVFREETDRIFGKNEVPSKLIVVVSGQTRSSDAIAHTFAAITDHSVMRRT